MLHQLLLPTTLVAPAASKMRIRITPRIILRRRRCLDSREIAHWDGPNWKGRAFFPLNCLRQLPQTSICSLHAMLHQHSVRDGKICLTVYRSCTYRHFNDRRHLSSARTPRKLLSQTLGRDQSPDSFNTELAATPKDQDPCRICRQASRETMNATHTHTQ